MKQYGPTLHLNCSVKRFIISRSRGIYCESTLPFRRIWCVPGTSACSRRDGPSSHIFARRLECDCVKICLAAAFSACACVYYVWEWVLLGKCAKSWALPRLKLHITLLLLWQANAKSDKRRKKSRLAEEFNLSGNLICSQRAWIWNAVVFLNRAHQRNNYCFVFTNIM